MLQLKHKAPSFELTDKNNSLTLTGRDVKLGEKTFSEPGEYEASGIELVYGTSAALVVWESLQIVYVFDAATPAEFERDQFSGADVLLFADDITQLGQNHFDALLTTYDPKIIIV